MGVNWDYLMDEQKVVMMGRSMVGYLVDSWEIYLVGLKVVYWVVLLVCLMALDWDALMDEKKVAYSAVCSVGR